MVKKALIFRDLTGLGERLNALRLQLGFKNAGDLAEILGGISASSITRWEQGKVEPPLEYVTHIAKESGVNLMWILFGDDNALNAKQSESPGEAPTRPVAAVQPPVTVPSPDNELERLRRKNDDLTDALLKAIAKWEGLSDEMLIKDARIKEKDKIIDGKNAVISQLSEANGKLVDILKEAGEEGRIPPDLIFSALMSLTEAGSPER